MAAKSEGASEALAEIEGIVERSAAWVGENVILVSVLVVALIAGAGAVGWRLSSEKRDAEAASNALDKVHSQYLKAMGASPGDIDVPELANPTAGAEIRAEYWTKYGEVAEQYPGTVAAVLARLEQGNLSEAGGDVEDSIAIWRQTLADLDGKPKLESIVYQRIGQAYEDAGQWLEAAKAHEAASAIEVNPLRYWAMADAARCYAQAGNRDQARALAERVEQEAPTLQLPGQLGELLREMRVTQ